MAVSEIRPLGADRRLPVAIAPGPAASFPDIGDAPLWARLHPPREQALQPVEDIIVHVEPAEISDRPERMILILEHPQLFLRRELVIGSDRVLERAERIELARDQQRRTGDGAEMSANGHAGGDLGVERRLVL